MTVDEAQHKAQQLFGEDDGHAWDMDRVGGSYSAYAVDDRFRVTFDLSAKRPTAFTAPTFEEAFEKAVSAYKGVSA